MMYPEAFLNWVGDRGYYRSKGIWYTWLDEEVMDTPVAENTEELFNIWKEKTGYKEVQSPIAENSVKCEHDWSAWKELGTGTWRRCWKCSEWDLKI